MTRKERTKRVILDKNDIQPPPHSLTDNDNDNDNNGDNKNNGWNTGVIKNASGRQKMMVIGGFIVAGVVLLIIYKRYSISDDTIPIESSHPEKEVAISRGSSKRVRWKDQEDEGDGELEEIREFEEQDRRMEQLEFANEIEGLLIKLDQTKEQIKANEGSMKKTASEMNEVFGDNTTSYDDTLTSMETEQSFGTAFMMKTDIDKKRQGMIQYTQELGKQQQQLMQQGTQIQNVYNQKQQEYTGRYGTQYIPRRALEQSRQPPPPVPQPLQQSPQSQYMQMQQPPVAGQARTPLASGSGPGDRGMGPMHFGVSQPAMA